MNVNQRLRELSERTKTLETKVNNLTEENEKLRKSLTDLETMKSQIIREVSEAFRLTG